MGYAYKKMFGTMSYGLVVILQSSIQIRKYHYVEREPQTTQASMCHTMMLQQHYPNLLPTLVI